MNETIYSLWQGIVETLSLAAFSFVLGLLIAIFLTILRLKIKSSIMTIFLSLIENLIRILPETLILFAVYFGGSWILSNIFSKELEISAFFACIFALSLILSVYASKILILALSHITKGEREAAHTLKLSAFKTAYHIILPQMWQQALPGLGNLWLIVLKDTALISLIGGNDLMSRTQLLSRNTQQPFTYYGILACIYLILTYFSEHCIKRMATHD